METVVFEQNNKQVIKTNGKFFTRVFENGESFESGDFNTLERAKENIGIYPKTENIYLNRLKEQYKKFKGFEKEGYEYVIKKHYNDYQAMRLFCLDTQLISFNDIELMEFEVNQSF